MALIPIWKDTYLTVPSDSSPLSYSIQMVDGYDENNNEVIVPIFYGKAWIKPDSASDTYEVNINKICQDYLKNEMPIDFRSVISMQRYIQTDAKKKFYVYNEDTQTLMNTYEFIYDWSYDDTVVYSTLLSTEMSHPINYRGANGMFYFRTYYNGANVVTIIDSSPFYGFTELDCTKAEYALYYLNKYGGWDSFLIEGSVIKKDNYKRYNVEKDYKNTSIDFGRRTYNTQIETTYTLNTGWLKEEESKILVDNVFSSSRLFIHNLNTDEISPVMVNDADATYKNRNNSGRKLINYTINVITSHTKSNLN